MYERYAKGVYINDILAELNSMGIKNAHGRPFTKNTVHKILKSEKYSGVYRYDDEVFTNIYPIIVDYDIFKIVQQKNEDNRYGGRAPDVVYILSKKIKCGYCGVTINGITGTSKNGRVNRYYCCSGVYGRKDCKKKSVKKDAFEETVLSTIMKAFNNLVTLNNLAEDIIEANKRRVANTSVLTLLLKEKQQAESAIENILVAIEKAVVTVSTTKRLQDMEAKLEDLRTKIMV